MFKQLFEKKDYTKHTYQVWDKKAGKSMFAFIAGRDGKGFKGKVFYIKENGDFITLFDFSGWKYPEWELVKRYGIDNVEFFKILTDEEVEKL